MLVLSRKENQRIRLGDDITITIVRVAGDQVRLGIDAPRTVPIVREELSLRNCDDRENAGGFHEASSPAEA